MSREQVGLTVVSGKPPELVVWDELSPCPYLPGRIARLPLRLPCRRLRRIEVDQRLAAGDRRQGFVLYRTACPGCAACEPLRIDVADFRFSRSQRRVLRRGDGMLSLVVGDPVVDQRRVELYNLHKTGRGLSDGHPPLDREGYRDFLVNSCCDSFELRFLRDGGLVGVAVVDRGLTSLSAVYCCYDPGQSRLSIGTYAILKQIQLCRELGVRYLYLGLYIEQCPAMAYKRRFLPHQRLLSGRWRCFGAPGTSIR
jgi:arginyl-tRNA--protein-N-Asp/Glu arginylyltransferase